jgi:ApbE superfamily uncharacterized protein (UPF0280 family)
MTTEAHNKRHYRSLVSKHKLETFRVVVKETDLMVRTERPLQEETTDLVLKHRMALERYIGDHPDFADRLTPYPLDPFAPPIVRTMMEAGQKAGVGPMGAVAGAVAEYVGRDLLAYSKEVIIENGGDIFIRTTFPLTVAILAGHSTLSGKLGVRINSQASRPVGVCTSSGTVGHSLSLGRADAAVVVSASAALADAAATAIGNAVSDKADVPSAIRLGEKIDGVLGIVVILDDKMGVWGNVELVRLG